MAFSQYCCVRIISSSLGAVRVHPDCVGVQLLQIWCSLVPVNHSLYGFLVEANDLCNLQQKRWKQSIKSHQIKLRPLSNDGSSAIKRQWQETELPLTRLMSLALLAINPGGGGGTVWGQSSVCKTTTSTHHHRHQAVIYCQLNLST